MNDQPTTPGSLAGIFTPTPPPGTAPATPPLPAGSEPSPPPATAAPPAPGSLADIFSPVAPATPAPAAQPTAQPSVIPAAATSAFSIEEFVSRHVADPETLFQGDGRKITQFKDLRGIAEGAMRELAAVQLELNQLRTGGAASPQAAGGAVLPETEAVQKLTTQLEALKPAAQRWQEHEARQGIRQNPAFRSEFDQPRAAILREIEATASEIGLERKEVEEFLRLDTEYKQAKWIKENVEDDVAAGLYRDKGRQFLGLSNQAKSVLESADPIATLREWEDYNNAFATKFAAKLGESAAQELQAATSRVLGNLTQSEDPFFVTDSGKAVLKDLNQRAADGRGFSADEVVEAMAMSQSAGAYKALAQSFRDRLVAAESELQRYRQLNPNPTIPNPVPGGAPAPGGDFYGFGALSGGGVQPLVRADQIRM